ncbi:conserved hypothetical protein [Candidatus Desulfarcum epimagneticum]|uniref:Transcriptional regulator n=1 Tax=uncultured Desulfobacteraceae bacterium TaxID=218296 RepID=A0A484HBR1_9BACT|nr:conserved hypothetical protein [uncultured Desulfobacteraceae bacterium]
MKFFRLNEIKKLYFGYEDIAKALEIAPASARVAASRYVAQGLLVRVKRNLYIIKDKWRRLDKESLFAVANLIRTPSYISFMTALERHEITTQMQRGFFESAASKRSGEVEIERVFFHFRKINPTLYFGFERVDGGFFIALPEKALLDAVYLKSMGRYDFDASSIDFSRFDPGVLNRFAEKFPERVRGMLKQNGYF